MNQPGRPPIEPAAPRRNREAQYRRLLSLVGEPRPDTGSDGPLIRSKRMRSIINCHRMVSAYQESTRVACVSEQYPTEIVYAAGAIPWNIESMAIMLAQSTDVNRIFQLTQEQELSRDICSFLRGPFGMIAAEAYPTPDVVLTNDQPCEGLSKMMFLAGRGFDVPVLGLHSPQTLDPAAVDYLVRQIEALLPKFGAALGIELGPDDLKQAVADSNRARVSYLRTVELLKSRVLPGVCRELQEVFGMNCFGSRPNAQLCEALYQDASRMESLVGRPRVLWIGQVPEESHELLEHIRKSVDLMFWAPLWAPNLMLLDEDKPLESIAERAIRYHWSTSRMYEDVERVSAEFHVDGILIANVWGCRNMMGMSPMLRDLARTSRLKYLTINTDLVDRNNYAFNHVKNRVDAFLELMI